MIVVIDNYDSFVHNLARYLRQLGQETQVVRNDAIDAQRVRAMHPQAIVLSPGPCTPNDAGCSIEIVRTLGQETPILGVCLGHQAIAAAFGAQIVRAKEPMHGRASPIQHDGRGVFNNVPNPLSVGRYHSLIVAADPANPLPDCLEISAQTNDGTIMAIRHRQQPTIGLQFHPESILTKSGYLLLANFLRIAGLPISTADLPNLTDECVQEK